MSANDKQVGGSHYQKAAGCCPNCGHQLQHWDVVSMFNLGYLIGNATKYLFRYREKNGVQDLEKAKHYIDKQIEELTAGEPRQEPERPVPNVCACGHDMADHDEHGCEFTFPDGHICQCDVVRERPQPRCTNCDHVAHQSLCTELVTYEPAVQCGCPGVCGDCGHAHAQFTRCDYPACDCGAPEV